MKITPDSSLFTALSSLPTPTEARQRSGGAADSASGQGFADRLADRNVSGKGQDAANRDELIRKALQDGRLRQAAVDRKRQAAAAENPPAKMAEDRRGSVTREAPFAASGAAGDKPQFVRLGQFVDIRV